MRQKNLVQKRKFFIFKDPWGEKIHLVIALNNENLTLPQFMFYVSYGSTLHCNVKDSNLRLQFCRHKCIYNFIHNFIFGEETAKFLAVFHHKGVLGRGKICMYYIQKWNLYRTGDLHLDNRRSFKNAKQVLWNPILSSVESYERKS